MKAWLMKYKWYFVHAAAVGVAFLNPSVQAWLAGHQAYAGPGLLAWGWILHRLDGK